MTNRWRRLAPLCALNLAGILAALPAQSPTAKRPSPKGAKPNAAVLYRQAIAEMNKAIKDPETGECIIPDGNYEDSTALLTEQWATILNKCAVALTLFAQGTQCANCHFDDDPETQSFELSVYGSGEDYGRLLMMQRAQGWHTLDSDPSGACVIALRMLDFSNHCAKNGTVSGTSNHIWVDRMAAQLLKAGIAKLPVSASATTTASFLKQLQLQMPNRMSHQDIAKAAKRQVQLILQHGFPEATRNPALPAASKRGLEMTEELLQPIHDNPNITSAAFEAHARKKLAAIAKLTQGTSIQDVLATGKSDVLAATMLQLVVGDYPFLLRGSAERLQQLEDCLEQLRQLASKK